MDDLIARLEAEAECFDLMPGTSETAELLREAAAALKVAPLSAEGNCPPQDVMEWIHHMDAHLTEHDERHAGLALRAAWPRVKAWVASLKSDYVQLRNRESAELKGTVRVPYVLSQQEQKALNAALMKSVKVVEPSTVRVPDGACGAENIGRQSVQLIFKDVPKRDAYRDAINAALASAPKEPK